MAATDGRDPAGLVLEFLAGVVTGISKAIVGPDDSKKMSAEVLNFRGGQMIVAEIVGGIRLLAPFLWTSVMKNFGASMKPGARSADSQAAAVGDMVSKLQAEDSEVRVCSKCGSTFMAHEHGGDCPVCPAVDEGGSDD